jgi:hypothetical protein
MGGMLRKLRIAFSVVCGILCLLLIALWVRSYWNYERLTCLDSSFWEFQSSRGAIFLDVTTDSRISSSANSRKLSFVTRPQSEIEWGPVGTWWSWPSMTRRPSITRGAPPLVQTISINVPFWLPILTIGIIVGGLWIPWSARFSLRTLLIATTLVAVVLGLAVAFR